MEGEEGRMSLRRAAKVVVVSAVALAACRDDSGPGSSITINDLVGSWNATTVTYTSQENPADRVDRIAGGGFATVTVAIDGGYVFVLMPAGAEAEVTSGFMVIESGFLLVQNILEPGVTIAFAMTVTSSALGLLSDEPTFDFNGDEEEEPAILQIGLRRASGTTIGDLEGSWAATEYRLISQPTAVDTFDIIAENGSLSVTFDELGRYTANVAEPGEPPIVETGAATIRGDLLILISTGQPSAPTEFMLEVSGDTVQLEGQTRFDFGGDGTVEDARVEIVLARP
jgi:hypothetical protein